MVASVARSGRRAVWFALRRASRAGSVGSVGRAKPKQNGVVELSVSPATTS